MSEAEEWKGTNRSQRQTGMFDGEPGHTAYLYAGGRNTEDLGVLFSLSLPVTCGFLLVDTPGHSLSLETVQERKATITHINLNIDHKNHRHKNTNLLLTQSNKVS